MHDTYDPLSVWSTIQWDPFYIHLYVVSKKQIILREQDPLCYVKKHKYNTLNFFWIMYL